MNWRVGVAQSPVLEPRMHKLHWNKRQGKKPGVKEYRLHLQTTVSERYAFLPSGVLIIEPDPELLVVRARLLMASDTYLDAMQAGVAGTAIQQVEVRVAVLSLSLEALTLTALAREIRLYWPNARTLIIGQSGLSLDEILYDDSIESRCRPEELLAALFRLQRDQSERAAFEGARIGAGALSLCGLGSLSVREF